MKYIAHRGLIYGPNEHLENLPDNVANTLNSGFEAEIDVWKVNDAWFLGHDKPQHLVSENFLSQWGLWIHCKNIEALRDIHSVSLYHYFWHQEDDFTLTSMGCIWTYPRKAITVRSVLVQPEWDNDWREQIKFVKCAGICSKYISEIKSILEGNHAITAI
jgi:hypothetical protein